MGLYRFHSTSASLIESINRFQVSHNLNIIPSFDTKDNSFLFQGRIKEIDNIFPFKIRFSLSEQADFIDMDCSFIVHRSFSFLHAFFIFIPFFVIPVFLIILTRHIRMVSNSIDDFNTNLFFAFPTILLVCSILFVNVFISLSAYSKMLVKIHKFEKTLFDSFLISNKGFIIIEPKYYFDDLFPIYILFLVCVIPSIVLFYLNITMLYLVFFILFINLVLPYLIRLQLQKYRSFAFWKLKLISIIGSWQSLCINLIFCLLMFYYFNIFLTVIIQHKLSQKSILVSEFISQSKQNGVLSAISSALSGFINSAYIDWNIQDARKAFIEPYFQSGIVVKLDGFTFMMMIVMSLFFIAVSLMVFKTIRDLLHIFKNTKEWKDISNNIYSHNFIEHYQNSTPVIAKGYIVLFFLINSVLNIFTILLTLDVLSLIVLNRSLIYPLVGNIFSILYMPFLIIPGWNKYIFIVDGILFIYILPSLLYIMMLIYKVIKFILSIFKHNDGINGDKMVTVAIKKLSDKLKIIMPIISLTMSNKIFSSRKLFSRNAIIYFPITYLNLEEDEKEILICHEMAHIKLHLQKLGVLRFISLILLFPNPLLELLIDTSKYEFEADQVAVKETGKRKEYLNLLDKLYRSEDNIVNPKPIEDNLSKKYLKVIKEYVTSYYYFFMEARIMGYVHPEKEFRMKHLHKE